ncbi:hypothetical protein KFE98_13280 [bacterium SCSIO 12741]|nr:hypothetical protein KFE98_13280 [bacterium SCSIO 12741]
MVRVSFSALFVGIALLFGGCDRPQLNGHYHLIWNKNSEVFQTWNIQHNRVVFNQDFCDPETEGCSASHIQFDGDSILVNPWVDMAYNWRYERQQDGSLWMIHKDDTFYLHPHGNCQSVETYFQERTAPYLDSFQLPDTTAMGAAALPGTFETEVIVGIKENHPVILYNGHPVQTDERGLIRLPKVNEAPIWLHVDQRLPIHQVIPILREMYFQNFAIQISSSRVIDNNEQIQLFPRHLRGFTQGADGIHHMMICDYCDSTSSLLPDTSLILSWIRPNYYSIQGRELNLGKVRNQIIDFLSASEPEKTCGIQVEFPGELSWNQYLKWVDEWFWIQQEIQDIAHYRGEDLPPKERLKHQRELRPPGSAGERLAVIVEEIILPPTQQQSKTP